MAGFCVQLRKLCQFFPMSKWQIFILKILPLESGLIIIVIFDANLKIVT